MGAGDHVVRVDSRPLPRRLRRGTANRRRRLAALGAGVDPARNRPWRSAARQRDGFAGRPFQAGRLRLHVRAVADRPPQFGDGAPALPASGPQRRHAAVSGPGQFLGVVHLRRAAGAGRRSVPVDHVRRSAGVRPDLVSRSGFPVAGHIAPVPRAAAIAGRTSPRLGALLVRTGPLRSARRAARRRSAAVVRIDREPGHAAGVGQGRAVGAADGARRTHRPGRAAVRPRGAAARGLPHGGRAGAGGRQRGARRAVVRHRPAAQLSGGGERAGSRQPGRRSAAHPPRARLGPAVPGLGQAEAHLAGLPAPAQGPRQRQTVRTRSPEAADRGSRPRDPGPAAHR